VGRRLAVWSAAAMLVVGSAQLTGEEMANAAASPASVTSGSSARLVSIPPVRLLDTRTGLGAVNAAVGPGHSVDVQVTGIGGVPATGIDAVVLNVTVTGPTASSYLTVYPTGSARPTASNLNFVAHQTVPNLVVARLGSGGKVTMFNAAGSTQVIADVLGWISHPPGSVLGWGMNDTGEQGDGTVFGRPTAAAVPSLTSMVSVAAGDTGAVVGVRSDGTLWGWGDSQNMLFNSAGPVAGPLFVPARVPNLTQVTSAAVAEFNMYALRSDGTVWGTGSAMNGALGTFTGGGSNGLAPAPVQIGSLTGIAAVAGADYTGYALKSDGTVWGWGKYDPNSDPLGYVTTPVQVGTLTNVVQIAAAGTQALALKSDGSVWTWGTSGQGFTPVQVTGLGIITSVAMGAGYSAGYGESFYAIANDGTLWAWGANNHGQLGDGGTGATSTPVQVPGLIAVVSVAANSAAGYAVTADGNVWAWGADSHGQLGDGQTTDSLTPVQVPAVANAGAIGAGVDCAFAVVS